jgi:hypothetical protein
MENQKCQAPEVDLFGQEVSGEVLESYMNENFEGEAQASIIALLAATLL